MSIIEIDNVSKTFKDKGKSVQALKNVSLRIEEGELFGILGPNGAGKSTLINILINLLYPDSGTVLIDGKELSKNPQILERMNYISGETRFHWSLTAREVLKLSAMLYNIPSKEADKRIETLLGSLGILSYADRRFDSLSTGQRVRLSLAKALLNKPKILLLDEPTLGLDPHIAVKVRAMIKKVNKEDKMTIILTSHYMQEIEQLCDRIAFINEGKILDIGTIESVKLKQFDSHKLIVAVDRLPTKRLIAKHSLAVKGKTLTGKIVGEGELNSILADLVKEGCLIKDIELRKPSLEDYFIKITEGGKKA